MAAGVRQVAGGVWPVLRLFSTAVALGSFERARLMWPQLGLKLLQKAPAVRLAYMLWPYVTLRVFWHLTGQPVGDPWGGFWWNPWLGPEGILL